MEGIEQNVYCGQCTQPFLQGRCHNCFSDIHDKIGMLVQTVQVLKDQQLKDQQNFSKAAERYDTQVKTLNGKILKQAEYIEELEKKVEENYREID